MKILAEKVASPEFQTSHQYNDKYRQELGAILSHSLIKYSTNFQENNWSEKTAYTLGYNKAVEDLMKFLLDNSEEIM
jgi:hypothetical protein